MAIHLINESGAVIQLPKRFALFRRGNQLHLLNEAGKIVDSIVSDPSERYVLYDGFKLLSQPSGKPIPDNMVLHVYKDKTKEYITKLKKPEKVGIQPDKFLPPGSFRKILAETWTKIWIFLFGTNPK